MAKSSGNATQAIFYHRDVLNVPQLNTIKLKAKLSFSEILNLPDPIVHELWDLLKEERFQQDLDYLHAVQEIHGICKNQVLISKISAKEAINNCVKDKLILKVQRKF